MFKPALLHNLKLFQSSAMGFMVAGEVNEAFVVYHRMGYFNRESFFVITYFDLLILIKFSFSLDHI